MRWIGSVGWLSVRPADRHLVFTAGQIVFDFPRFLGPDLHRRVGVASVHHCPRQQVGALAVDVDQVTEGEEAGTPPTVLSIVA